MLGRLGSLEDEIPSHAPAAWGRSIPGLVAKARRDRDGPLDRRGHPLPEALPTLAALRERGLKLGLISNCSAQAGAVLERIGLAECFDAVTSPAMSAWPNRPRPSSPRLSGAWRYDLAGVFVADGAFTELDAARRPA